MDPRYRADETLARARARGAFVVTPDNATSPMDAAQTQRIPREVVSGDDPDPTLQLRGQETEGSAAWPTEDYQQQRNDHYGRPADQDTSQQATAQQPTSRQRTSQQHPSQQHPASGGQEPPQAPQWPTAQYPGDQYSDGQYSDRPNWGGQYSTGQGTADQGTPDEWSWPTTRFGPLNPETARGLQW